MSDPSLTRIGDVAKALRVSSKDLDVVLEILASADGVCPGYGRSGSPRLVRTAVKVGLMHRPDSCSRCGDGGSGIHGHHEDYSKPLDVMWLCPRCHMRRHRELRAENLRRNYNAVPQVEAAEALEMKYYQVDKLCWSGQLVEVVVGGYRFIDSDSLNAYLAKHGRPPVPTSADPAA